MTTGRRQRLRNDLRPALKNSPLPRCGGPELTGKSPVLRHLRCWLCSRPSRARPGCDFKGFHPNGMPSLCPIFGRAAEVVSGNHVAEARNYRCLSPAGGTHHHEGGARFCATRVRNSDHCHPRLGIHTKKDFALCEALFGSSADPALPPGPGTLRSPDCSGTALSEDCSVNESLHLTHTLTDASRVYRRALFCPSSFRRT